jgi:hypothetical protein
VAVGEEEKGSDWLNLTETFNGSTWTVSKSINPSSTFNELYGVSCASSSSCVAVGSYQSNGIYFTLGESWNGQSWTKITTVDPSTTADQLSGSSCSSASHCVAVGIYIPDFDNPGAQTLIETGS